MHCIHIILVDENELNRLKEKNNNFQFVELPQKIYAITEDENIQDINGLLVDTDYFGGCGDQYSELYIDGKLIKNFDSINEGLKKVLKVNKEKDKDEFDTINLGQYRKNSDFKKIKK